MPASLRPLFSSGILAALLGASCGGGDEGAEVATSAAAGGTQGASAGASGGAGTSGNGGAAGAAAGSGGAGGKAAQAGAAGNAAAGQAGAAGGSGGPAVAGCAYKPGNDLDVCTASYLGGAGTDAPTAVDVGADGTVVVGGSFPGVELGVPPAVLGAGPGAIVRLGDSGRKVLSVTRVAGAVKDLEIARSAGTIAVLGDAEVTVLSAKGDVVVWKKPIAGGVRVAAAADGTVAVLHASTISVFDPAGAQLGSFPVSGKAQNDIAIDGASKTVFFTGYKQDDGDKCTQYKSTFVRAYSYAGASVWTNYDWTKADVGASGDCADSQGLRLSLGRDGKLYYVGKSDGGNTVHQKDPRDLSKKAPNVSFDPYNECYGFKGAGALGYFARFDAKTGQIEAGQTTCARKAGPGDNPASAEANAATPSAIAADEKGNVFLVGGSAYQIKDHDLQTVSGQKVGSYVAYELFAMVVSADFKQRPTWTVFTKTGPADAVSIAAGAGVVALLGVQSAAQLAKGTLITTGTAVASAPLGGDDAYLATWPAP